MPDYLERLEAALKETREMIRRERRELTGGRVEDAAREAGADLVQAVDRFFFELDKRLALASMEAQQRAHTASEELDETAQEWADALSDLRDDVKARRLEITGGRVEEGFRGALSELDERVDGLVKRLRGEGEG